MHVEAPIKQRPRPVANPLDIDSVSGFVATMNMAVPRLTINAGVLALAAFVYAPALIPLAAVAVIEHTGRNHNMRQRPDIGRVSALRRAGEKVYHHTHPHEQHPVWLARNEDQRAALGTLDPAAYMRRIGWRQSWPFKAFSYARLGVAMLQDQANHFRTMRFYGQGGARFHEGVAAARLANGNWITPNPRTQQHIDLARQWYASEGKTLG